MNKRIMSLIAVVVLLATMFAFTAAASASGYYPVYSHCPNGKPLNVRAGPGKEYPVLEQIPYGDVIYVIGETFPGWLQLNDAGYVQASLTSNKYPGPYVPPTPTPSPEKKEESSLNDLFASAVFVNPYMITVKATKKSKGQAVVRWMPTKNGRAMKNYAAGSQLRVLAEMGNWYQVEDPMTEMVGFLNIAYVE